MTRREPRRFSILTALLWAAGLAVLSGVLGPPRSSGKDSVEERCRSEVLEIHGFFQDWFNGVLEPTDESFARLAGVLEEDFVLISPSGALTERGPLLERLRGAHGAWKESGEGKIRIGSFRLHRQAKDFLVVSYEEWQEIGGEVQGRVSTAVFGRRKGAPNGVAWLHLHETALPSSG